MKKLLLVSLLFSIFFANIYAQQTKRYTLIEDFGNTFCPPCIKKHPHFNKEILSTYEDKEVHHISYHISSPLPRDTFFQFNPQEINDRDIYYPLNGTPSVFIRGKFEPLPPYNGGINDSVLVLASVVEELTNDVSPLKIDASEIVDGNKRTVTINLQTLGALPEGDFKLQVVVVERYVEYTPPYEGMEEELHNVFRQTLGGWNQAFFAPPSGISTTYSYEYNIHEDWQEEQTYVIAFVQDFDSQEVMNSASSWGNIEEVVVNPPDPPNPVDTNTVTSTAQIINKEVVVYPNPMEQQLQILLPSEVKNGQISLLDVQGRVVWQRNHITAKTNYLTADVSHLTSGIYYVKIRLNGVDIVKKVLKM